MPDDKPRRLRAAWRRWWVKGIVIALVVVLVAGAAGGTWVWWQYRHIHRVRVPVAAEPVGEPQNFLIVGSDSRAFVQGTADKNAYGTASEVGPPHADTILLARIYPAEHRVAMVSFPRDLWLQIAGGGEARINSAIESGPDTLILTLEQALGVAVHHFVSVDFRGFKGLVNAIGGVDIYFPAPVRDWDSQTNVNPTGLSIPNPGCVRLNGDQALAYVRSRHFERLIDGQWQPDAGGDLNRISRQQDFLRRVLGQSLDSGILRPDRLRQLVRTGVENVQLDTSLGLDDLLRLARQFRSLSPEALQTYSLPTTPGRTKGGADVLFLDRAAADPILDVFRGKVDQPAVLVPSAVRVRVLAGTGVAGLQVAAYRIAAAGFDVADFGGTGQRVRQTVIRYGPGQQPKAELLAAQLVARPQLVEDPAITGVDAVLTLGNDWKGVSETLVAVPTSTTTSVAPSSSAPPASTSPTTATTAAESTPPVDEGC